LTEHTRTRRYTYYTWLQDNRFRGTTTPFDEEVHFGRALNPVATVNSPVGDPALAFLANEKIHLLGIALNALPVEFREALVLRAIEELSYKDIAVITAVPIGTVMSRLARGRKLLSAKLSQLTQESCDEM
jgi:RNA polymerase sigma-70 factor (ECF subfamily)